MAWFQVRKPFLLPCSAVCPAQSACVVLCCAYEALCFAGLTERQQLALAMEESKKAAAALQAKDRQASRPMDSEVTPVFAHLTTECLLSMLLCMQPYAAPSCFAFTSSQTVMHNDNWGVCCLGMLPD